MDRTAALRPEPLLHHINVERHHILKMDTATQDVSSTNILNISKYSKFK